MESIDIHVYSLLRDQLLFFKQEMYYCVIRK